MARLCENDHEVREGMFVCPVCGSDDVSERERGVAAAATAERPAEVLRERAEQRLTGFITRGAALLVAAVVCSVVSFAAVAEGSGAGYGFFVVVAWVLGLAGAAYLLCGVVGWGVKYGNEATARE